MTMIITFQLSHLPSAKDTNASAFFTNRLRSLSTYNDPVPKEVTTKLFVTLSINILPCPTNSCRDGPYNGGYRIATSINNVSFVESKSMDILRAYYNHIDGIFTTNFPDKPTSTTNYTGDMTILEAVTAHGTRVKVLEYDSVVEVVFQGTNLLFGVDHPMHLHGMSFYVVGSGFGNFDEMRDPKSYNLVDPPLVNTIAVPRNGWTVIRFRASNPVWLMHCHLERHVTWGMQMVFIINEDL
ncbi:unnamed protein product [Linum trigynum]|uniref:Plastocyanin-like domain-containing protein n=1 Tax=Linum trigynum TaxID=586398 RepID=A0AAV2C8U9_9ROSI